MKITKQQLRRIIKEEINRTLLEEDLTTPEGRAKSLAGFLNTIGVDVEKNSDAIRKAGSLPAYDTQNSPKFTIWQSLENAGLLGDLKATDAQVKYEDWREESYDDGGGDSLTTTYGSGY